MSLLPLLIQDWCTTLPPCCPWTIRLQLQVFRKVLYAVVNLHSESIVHYDIKCSNVLLEPLEGIDGSQPLFWTPQSEHPNFSVVLSDFGEARCYRDKEAAVTMIHRYGSAFL